MSTSTDTAQIDTTQIDTAQIDTAQIDHFPSRDGVAEGLSRRQDPVRWGSHDGPLGDRALTSYERDGYLIAPDLIGRGVIDSCLAAIEELRQQGSGAVDAEGVAEPDDDTSLRSLFRIDRHPAFAQLMSHPTLLGIARQLLGSDVYLHQSRINLKQAFVGRGFPWHSDFETWHVEDGMPRMRAVSCSVALTENGPHNGPLLLISGSHQWYVSCPGRTPDNNHLSSLREQKYGVPDTDSLRQLAELGDTETFTGGPGSVVFFECNTMHGSGDNISPNSRTSAFFVYNSIDNQLVEPFGAEQHRPEHLAARELVSAEHSSAGTPSEVQR